MQELIGKTFGTYQIVEQIGKGGMATIFKAYQPSLEREVAIKVMPPYFAKQDESFTTRFKREARSIAKLRHPNILVVMDFGEEGEYPYIVMEYVPAGTLKEHMEAGPMTLREISALMAQIASALDYAHGEDVVHRDIKPSNILMPKKDWALLTDFGLARMVGGSLLTQSGMTVGTPAYMSPEQGSGEAVDHRTDIYALGVMLYEMLVGEVPYTAETPMAVVVKHIVEPLPMPRAKRPDLPEEVQRIVLKALAKSPADRYQRAGELAEALHAALGEHGDWSAANLSTVQTPAAAAPATPAPTPDPTGVLPREAALAAVLGAPAATEPAQTAATPAAAPTKKRNLLPLFIGGGLVLLLVAVLAGGALLRGLRANRAARQPTAVALGQSPFATPDPNQPAGGEGNAPQPGVLPLPAPPELTNHADPVATGRELLADGDVEGAAAAFYQAMRQVPAMYAQVRDLAFAAYENGDPATAARLLEVALVTQVRPSLDDMEVLANAYEDNEDYTRATAVYQFLVEARPTDTWLYYSLGNNAVAAGLADPTLQTLERLARRLPEEPSVAFGRGLLLAELGHTEDALAAYQQAVQIDPDFWDAYIEVAASQYQLGRIAEGDRTLQDISERAWDDGGMQDWIGWTYLDYERYEPAIRVFRRAIELDPGYAWSKIGLGNALAGAGQNLAEAEQLYNRAHEQAIQQEDLWTSLSAGWGFYYMGNCDRALEIWDDILAIDPDFYDAQDARSSCAP